MVVYFLWNLYFHGRTSAPSRFCWLLGRLHCDDGLGPLAHVRQKGKGPEKGYEISVFSYLNYRRIPFFVPRRNRLGNRLSPDSKLHGNSDLTRNLKRFPKSFFHGPNIFILLIFSSPELSISPKPVQNCQSASLSNLADK